MTWHIVLPRGWCRKGGGYVVSRPAGTATSLPRFFKENGVMCKIECKIVPRFWQGPFVSVCVCRLGLRVFISWVFKVYAEYVPCRNGHVISPFLWKRGNVQNWVQNCPSFLARPVCKCVCVSTRVEGFNKLGLRFTQSMSLAGTATSFPRFFMKNGVKCKIECKIDFVFGGACFRVCVCRPGLGVLISWV